MDNTNWMLPPLAAQPAAIQSTAGAVPVMNEKGELSMKKVKVQRYVSGKRPDYAPASSDEELSEDEDFTQPKAPAPSISPQHKTLTEVELQDPRLRRLRTVESVAKRRSNQKEGHHALISRKFHKAEVVEMSDEEEDLNQTATKPGYEQFSQSHKLAESDTESEGEVDEDELAVRRLKMRDIAILKVQEEHEVLGKEEEGSEESSEESSEYTEESESEEEGPRLKPVFVHKKDRVTIHQKDSQLLKAKQLEIEGKKRGEERRRETLRLIEQQNRQLLSAAAQNGEADMNEINTDDEADDAEYEAWKLRELKRLKRDKEERENLEKDKEEVDRLRNMTDEQRRLELRNNPKTVTNKAMKGKYKFLQKYYHRGVFFLNEEEELYKRDFSGATLEDHFDKTILPKVMQVKNFGRSGRTKYTHLVDQDTTSFDSPWAADTQLNHKFANSSSGGIKAGLDRPQNKKRLHNTTSARK